MTLPAWFVVGARVRTVRPIEIYPIDIFPVGLTGVVTSVEASGPIVGLVRLDAHHEGLSEWDNELQVHGQDSDEDGDCRPDAFTLVEGEEPTVLQTTIALIAKEFRDFPAETIPYGIPHFMMCGAWHNDTCPIWRTADDRLVLGVDFVDRELREFPECHRFGVHVDNGHDGSTILYSGDCWTTAKLVLWTAHLGLGFHPDTRGADYVDAEGKRCFDDEQAAALDRDVEAAFGICDPYETSITVWHALGLVELGEDAAA